MLGLAIKNPLPMDCTMPSWMQGERYEFCDRFENDFVHPNKKSLWIAVKNFFA